MINILWISIDNFAKAINKGQQIDAITVDFNKAFIDSSILRIRGQLWHWMRNFLVVVEQYMVNYPLFTLVYHRVLYFKCFIVTYFIVFDIKNIILAPLLLLIFINGLPTMYCQIKYTTLHWWCPYLLHQSNFYDCIWLTAMPDHFFVLCLVEINHSKILQIKKAVWQCEITSTEVIYTLYLNGPP